MPCPAALWVWLLASLSPAWGQTQESPPATLAEVLALAASRNPEIAAARAHSVAARAGIRVARQIPDLEFALGYEGVRRNSLDLGSADETVYRISQTIPFPSKIVFRSRAAVFEARRREEVYRFAERDVSARVKGSYYALLFADRALRISEENVEILQKFARIAANRYSVGKSSQSDVLRAQVELSKANNMVVTVGQELESLRARLNSLLDRSPHAPFGDLEEPAVAPLPKSYAELEALALQTRPEILQALHEVRKSEAEVSAMKSEYLPDFTMEYAWRNMETAPNDSSVMFKVNVPLWFWRPSGQVSAARSERRRAMEGLRTARAATRSDILEFMVHVDTARRLVELYRTTLLPQAEQSLRVAEAAYRSDRIDFLTLLDSERTLIEFRLEYFRNLAEYGKNSAHLERALGVDLAQLGGGSS